MTYEHVYTVRKDASNTAQTGSLGYNLPDSGTIPEIVLTVYTTQTASTDPCITASQHVREIRVIAGNQVIKKFKGEHAIAESMYLTSLNRASPQTNDNAVEGYETFKLILGKESLGFAPDFAQLKSKYGQPRLEVDFDASLTTADTGWTMDADTTPATKISVLCKIARAGTHSLKHGFIETRTIKTWTQVASTETVTELPHASSGLLMGLYLHGGYDTKKWTEDFDQIKLSIDNDRVVPLNLQDAESVVGVNDLWHGASSVSFIADLTSAIEYDFHMGLPTAVLGQLGEGALSIEPFTFRLPFKHIGVEAPIIQNSLTAADSTYRQFQFVSHGLIPYNVMYIPMSQVVAGSKFLKIGGRKVELKTTSSSSASTSSTPDVLAQWLSF